MPDSPVTSVAANVRRIREENDISQHALADRMTRLGHPWRAAAVSRLEAGDRTLKLDEIGDLAYCLGVPLAALLDSGDPDNALQRLQLVLTSRGKRVKNEFTEADDEASRYEARRRMATYRISKELARTVSEVEQACQARYGTTDLLEAREQELRYIVDKVGPEAWRGGLPTATEAVRSAIEEQIITDEGSDW